MIPSFGHEREICWGGPTTHMLDETKKKQEILFEFNKNIFVALFIFFLQTSYQKLSALQKLSYIDLVHEYGKV